MSRFKKLLGRWAFIVILLFLAGGMFAQETDTLNKKMPDYFDDNFMRIENYIYRESIRTVKLHKANDLLSLPVIDLNSEEQLILRFDDLADESKDYSYKIIHCTSDWEDSRLSPFDYLDGFEENQIRDFSFSFNTFRNFCHYNLLLPNDDVRFLASGNYLIKVYESGQEDNPAFTHRFMVYETLVQIEAEAKRSTILDEMKSHQEVDFKIVSQIPINDPYREMRVILTQNGRWDNRIDGLQPKFIRNNELLYDLEKENSFPGGSEFRYFNSKDIEFRSEGIERIRYEKPYYYFDLKREERKRFKVYYYNEDINGNYQIDNIDGENMDTDADYVYVTFELAYDAPVVNGNIYVYGALSNWFFCERNKMKYNFEKKSYELTMLLKQGYYNYIYAFLEDGQRAANIGYIEGDHYETENDYQVFVYLKENSSRFEKLIGFTSVNSLKKI